MVARSIMLFLAISACLAIAADSHFLRRQRRATSAAKMSDQDANSLVKLLSKLKSSLKIDTKRTTVTGGWEAEMNRLENEIDNLTGCSVQKCLEGSMEAEHQLTAHELYAQLFIILEEIDEIMEDVESVDDFIAKINKLYDDFACLNATTAILWLRLEHHGWAHNDDGGSDECDFSNMDNRVATFGSCTSASVNMTYSFMEAYNLIEWITEEYTPYHIAEASSGDICGGVEHVENLIFNAIKALKYLKDESC